ncbi:hypothetical protein B0H11DRAFT_1900559 [Mycena galericulata]|nr:hypothetical protein B0H11DRAFT_1900559 [Mycena galericulata]
MSRLHVLPCDSLLSSAPLAAAAHATPAADSPRRCARGFRTCVEGRDVCANIEEGRSAFWIGPSVQRSMPRTQVREPGRRFGVPSNVVLDIYVSTSSCLQNHPFGFVRVTPQRVGLGMMRPSSKVRLRAGDTAASVLEMSSSCETAASATETSLSGAFMYSECSGCPQDDFKWRLRAGRRARAAASRGSNRSECPRDKLKQQNRSESACIGWARMELRFSLWFLVLTTSIVLQLMVRLDSNQSPTVARDHVCLVTTSRSSGVAESRDIAEAGHAAPKVCSISISPKSEILTGCEEYDMLKPNLALPSEFQLLESATPIRLLTVCASSLMGVTLSNIYSQWSRDGFKGGMKNLTQETSGFTLHFESGRGVHCPSFNRKRMDSDSDLARFISEKVCHHRSLIIRPLSLPPICLLAYCVHTDNDNLSGFEEAWAVPSNMRSSRVRRAYGACYSELRAVVCVPASAPLEFKPHHFAQVQAQSREAPRDKSMCNRRAGREGEERASAVSVEQHRALTTGRHRDERVGVGMREGLGHAVPGRWHSRAFEITRQFKALPAARHDLAFPLDVRTQCNSGAAREDRSRVGKASLMTLLDKSQPRVGGHLVYCAGWGARSRTNGQVESPCACGAVRVHAAKHLGFKKTCMGVGHWNHRKLYWCGD